MSESIAGDRSSRESRLERWFARLLEKSNAEKALLISAISFFLRFLNSLVVHRAANSSSFRATVRVEVLAVFEQSLWVMVAFWALMVICGLIARRRAPEGTLYVTVVVQGVSLSSVWVAYLSGQYTSPALLVAVGFLVLCFLAFPQRIYLPAAVICITSFAALGVAERMALIPYGPLFLNMPGGVGEHPNRTAVLLAVLTVSIALLIIGGAFVFIVRRLRAREALLREESRTDPLTDLPNRRYLLETAVHELARATRQGRPISLMLVDVDHFKQVNDRFGHPAGDQVLTLIARRLSRVLREEDTIARIGGEEFVAILPHADAHSAEMVAERCRRSVAEAEFDLNSVSCRLTVSIGVAVHEGTSPLTAEELIARADEALYRAKAAGRNCIRFGRGQGEEIERSGDERGISRVESEARSRGRPRNR